MNAITIQSPVTEKIEELYNAYLEDLITQGKSRTAIRNFRNPTRKLIGFLKERDIFHANQITEHLLDEFQTWLYVERGISYWSVVAYIRDIRNFFNYLVDHGQLESNVLKSRRTMPQPEIPTKQQAHYYTYEEVESRYLAHQRKWVTYCYLNKERKHIKGFVKYLRSNEIKSFYSVTEKILLNYRDYLWEEFVHAHKDGLVVRSQKERLCCIVRLFNYLEKEGILKVNPSRPINWRPYYREIFEKAKKLPPKAVENNNLTEFAQYKREFLEYERTKGKSSSTVRVYKKMS
jgi:site-specific recombinase XerD